MEFKKCEEYVLAELEKSQKLNETLQEQLGEKDLTIQALEMQLAEYRNALKEKVNLAYVSLLETCFDDLSEIHDYYMALISRITDRFAVFKTNGDFQYSFAGFPSDEKERKEFCEALLEFKKIEINNILEDTDE